MIRVGSLDHSAIGDLAGILATAVFRTGFDQPGFAHLDLGRDTDPSRFRAGLISLGRALATEYERNHGEPLRFVSVSRFDQQAATRPHRDGGPDASVLLLGYEPTEVKSRVMMMDYTRAAADRGMTPARFLDECNPAFGEDSRLLDPYTVELTGFESAHYQIVAVNNSNLDVTEGRRGMLGLLHHAAVMQPRTDRARYIDSVLMGVTESGLDEGQLEAFAASAAAATV